MKEMEFNFETEEEKEKLDFEQVQMPLGALTTRTYVDVVFVIDVTGSMQPCIDTVKEMVAGLYDQMVTKLQEFDKELKQFRAKVIAFRDYYWDGKYAMEESDFFYLPKEVEAFREFVDKLEAKGGGDVPENALEALALAMKSDWVEEVDNRTSRRHVVMLFTDAPAHPLEKDADAKPALYPTDMFKSYGELMDAWNGTGQGTCLDEEIKGKMDPRARRLVLFVPDDEVWNDMRERFANTQATPIPVKADKGAREISQELILNLLCRSCS